MSLLAFIRIVLIEIRFGLVRLFKYPVKAVVDSLVLYIIFLGLAQGVKAIVPYPIPGSELSAAIAAFLLWYYTLMSIDGMGQSLIEEAQVGTLEQICLSRFSLRIILLSRFVGSLVTGSLMIFLVLTTVVLTTNTKLNLTWSLMPSAIIIIILVALGIAGLGFIIGCIVLLVKRLGNILTLIQFGLLFLVLIPLDRLAPEMEVIFKLTPIIIGTEMLTNVIGAGLPLLFIDVASMVVVSTSWLLLGYIIFGFGERYARTLGLLGHY